MFTDIWMPLESPDCGSLCSIALWQSCYWSPLKTCTSWFDLTRLYRLIIWLSANLNAWVIREAWAGGSPAGMAHDGKRSSEAVRKAFCMIDFAMLQRNVQHSTYFERNHQVYEYSSQCWAPITQTVQYLTISCFTIFALYFSIIINIKVEYCLQCKILYKIYYIVVCAYITM